MASNINFPVYYGNTVLQQQGTTIQVGSGGKGGWSGAGSGAAEGASTGAAIGSIFGAPGAAVGGIIGGIVGGVSGFMLSNGDPGYATVPAAPTFSPGTMPTQNFTNNDFGDFNTPSMQDTANAAHPGILVQPPPPPPPPPPKTMPPGIAGGGLQGQQSIAAQNVVNNSRVSGLNPQTISNDYLFSKGNTPQDQLLSGGTPPHLMSYLKSLYGQTPNTAVSKAAISVPTSYASTGRNMNSLVRPEPIGPGPFKPHLQSPMMPRPPSPVRPQPRPPSPVRPQPRPPSPVRPVQTQPALSLKGRTRVSGVRRKKLQ